MFEKFFFEKNTRLMKSYINLNYKTLITTYNPGTSNSLVAIFFAPVTITPQTRHTRTTTQCK
ncbi:hypothetical protein SEH50133_04911 [Salmonella enterica subsp. houtenae serovar 50:g,z51:- str. 01-0133]|nr:hypothetical protein SEH50133_04911 [Salmonella enterica subsp. houtenae serovar 50:g,z51:- str. 01-0133]